METIAVPLLPPFAVAPKFILNLKDDDWQDRLWGSKEKRIKMIYPYITERVKAVG